MHVYAEAEREIGCMHAEAERGMEGGEGEEE